jgi:hypothetical protein
MTTTLPDIDFKRYGVVIKKTWLIFVKDTNLFDKRYVFLFKLFKRGKAIHTQVKRKMKVETGFCFIWYGSNPSALFNDWKTV